MTKKISPDFLRQPFVLNIFCTSLNFFSQSFIRSNANSSDFSFENKIDNTNSSISVDKSLVNTYGAIVSTNFLNTFSNTLGLIKGYNTVRINNLDPQF